MKSALSLLPDLSACPHCGAARVYLTVNGYDRRSESQSYQCGLSQSATKSTAAIRTITHCPKSDEGRAQELRRTELHTVLDKISTDFKLVAKLKESVDSFLRWGH